MDSIANLVWIRDYQPLTLFALHNMGLEYFFSVAQT